MRRSLAPNPVCRCRGCLDGPGLQFVLALFCQFVCNRPLRGDAHTRNEQGDTENDKRQLPEIRLPDDIWETLFKFHSYYGRSV